MNLAGLLRAVDRTKYKKRVSGLLLHRVDIHVELPRVDCQRCSDVRLGEP